MQDGFHIQKYGVLWVHKEIHLRLSLEELYRLKSDLNSVIPMLESTVAERVEGWNRVSELDRRLRSEQQWDWLGFVQLIGGKYELLDSINCNWTQFWNSVSQTEESMCRELIEWGAFDNLLWLDPSCVQQDDTNWKADRLRELSEPMEWLEACTFEMGDDSLDAWEFERPVHSVVLSKGIWVGKYPVTQQLYWFVMKQLPSFTKGECGSLKPVVQVSWWDAIQFCNRLSIMTGREPVYFLHDTILDDIPTSCLPSQIQCTENANGYRLLTEAEWECAARAFQPFEYAGSAVADKVAWTVLNSKGLSKTVGKLEGNALGLCDMSGNVWEWVWDGYDADFYASSELSDPKGESTSVERVCRGGSFLGEEMNARVSLRGRAESTSQWTNLGFRIACSE
jgi:formylglycine-generating enzyme required for sulfatase activity